MTRSRLALATTALFAAIVLTSPAPAEADLGWFGLHIGTGGVGVSLGFGSWWAWTDAWASGPADLDFNVALEGYGEWVWVDGLGRVWRPWVAADWRPYTNGRWVWTSVGWTWVAYEPWGYLPHHFGNWALTPVGWTWVPGAVYTPASVVWVGSGTMIGWYACPPHGWSHASRGFRRGYEHGWGDGYSSGYRDGSDDARYASFVGWNHLADDDLSRRSIVGYAVPRGNRVQVMATPPSRSEVARRSGRPVPEARLEQRTVRVSGREVSMARPVGLERSVQAHADDTVRRALSPKVTRELDSARARLAPAVPANSGQEINTRPAAAAPRSQERPDVLRTQPAQSPRPSASTPRRTEQTTPSPEQPSAARAGSGNARIQPAPATRVPSGTGRTQPVRSSEVDSLRPTIPGTRAQQIGAPSRPSAVTSGSGSPSTARRVEAGARTAPARAQAGTSSPPAARAAAGASRSPTTTARPAPRGRTTTDTTQPTRTRRQGE